MLGHTNFNSYPSLLVEVQVPAWLTHPMESWCLVIGWIEATSKKICYGTSLVALWIRVCLPMQGTRVRSLVWGDSAYCGVNLCSRASEPQLLSPCGATAEACEPRAPAPRREMPSRREARAAVKGSPRPPQLEKACMQQLRPRTAKNKSMNTFLSLGQEDPLEKGMEPTPVLLPAKSHG